MAIQAAIANPVAAPDVTRKDLICAGIHIFTDLVGERNHRVSTSY